MYCSNCGAKLPDGAKFCEQCGAPVGGSARTNTSQSTAPNNHESQAEGFIDRAADDIGGGIDEALGDIRDGFKRPNRAASGTDQSAHAESADASQADHAGAPDQSAEPPVVDAEVVDDRADAGSANGADQSDPNLKDTKSWFTPENIEKYAVIALFFPLFMRIASWLFGLLHRVLLGASFSYLLSGLFDFIYGFVGFISNAVAFIFFVCSIAGMTAMLFTVLNAQRKQNAWGWISVAAGGVAMMAAFGSVLHWNWILTLVLTLAAAVYGVDAISRVFLQHSGVESEIRPGADIREYKTAYDRYQAAHPSGAEAEAERIASDPKTSYFEGHGSTLFGYYILYVLLLIFTASIGDAWMTAKIYRWEYKNTVIDGKRLKFNGSGGSLLGHWIIWNFLTSITLGIYALFRHVALLKWEMRHTYYDGERGADDSYFDGNTWQYIGYGLLQALLLVLTLGLAYPWTYTMILKWETKHKVINSERLYYDGTALGILVQYLVVYLLTIVTLGFYLPWGVCRIERYTAAHTHISGTVA